MISLVHAFDPFGDVRGQCPVGQWRDALFTSRHWGNYSSWKRESTLLVPRSAKARVCKCWPKVLAWGKLGAISRSNPSASGDA